MKSFTNIAFIGIGANLGDKVKTCIQAIQEIHSHPECKILKLSSFYETEPLGKGKNAKAAWYVNSVMKLKTSLKATGLLKFLLELETRLGRVRSHEKWESRTIDLDLLFFNEERQQTALLTLPHPELHKRRFVLEPLCEIEPDWIHPVFRQTVQQLFDSLHDQKKVLPLFKFSPLEAHPANRSDFAPWV